MRVCLFEDDAVAGLEPLTLTRPAFALLSGCGSLADKQFHLFGATSPGAIVRPSIAPLLREPFAVNDECWLRGGSTVFVNARWLPLGQTPIDTTTPHIGRCGDEVAYAIVPLAHLTGLTANSLPEHLDRWQAVLPQRKTKGMMIRYLWQLVDANSDSLWADFALCDPTPGAELACLGPRDRLAIAPDATLEPHVVADTTQGPVIVDSGATIGAFTRLAGPCYIGPGTQIHGAKIRPGTTLGPGCRIGGEVEASIVQGFSNKYHDGFLGHAYVGSWVNLGAGTSNSDLRNDYGPVRVMVNGQLVDTGRTKVGCFLGDHVKAAIGCLINTGTSVGPFAGLLPSGNLLPRHVPAFCNVMDGELVENPALDALIATARVMMNRRERPLTPAQEMQYRALFTQTMLSRHRMLRERERTRIRVGA